MASIDYVHEHAKEMFSRTGRNHLSPCGSGPKFKSESYRDRRRPNSLDQATAAWLVRRWARAILLRCSITARLPVLMKVSPAEAIQLAPFQAGFPAYAGIDPS